MKRYAVALVFGICGMVLSASWAIAQQPLIIKALAEKKVADLPPGPLFWRIENFADRGQAHAAEGAWSLVAESAGKIWLFTLGAPGGARTGRYRGCRAWSHPACRRFAVSVADQRS